MINENFLLKDEFGNSLISPGCTEKAERLIDEYKKYARNWVWFPNATENGELEPPSGFAMTVVAKNTPIKSNLFSNKMFQGTSVYQIPNGARFLDGKLLTEQNVMRESDKIKNILNSVILENPNENSKFNIEHLTGNGKKGSEESDWDVELGGSGSFIGLYMSSKRDGYKNKNDFWIVTQSYFPSANDEIADLIIEAEHNKKMTWEKFFIDNSNNTLKYCEAAIKRNRCFLSAKFAEGIRLVGENGQIQFELDREVPMNSKKKNKLMPTVETITNNVSIHDGKPIYRCGVVDPNNPFRRGIIFNENPFIGSYILNGPQSMNSPFGGLWTASPHSLSSFPVCTGRGKNIPTIKEEFSNTKYSPHEIEKFVWQFGQNNLRLAENVYNIRDEKFKSIEKKIGYDHENGETHLIPLVVKIASTEQPKNRK